MTESIKTGDEDGISALEVETEAFIDGSSQFTPNLTTVGFQSTLNHLSKWLVVALFGAAVLWRHDAEALWASLGSVLNSALSIVLKRIVNQERPVSTLRPTSTSDPGMPSSHAQSIFYAVVFAIFSLVEWLGLNALTTTVIGLVVAVGSYFSWLRVSLQFHTISQVAVGAAVGSVFSILWLWLWDAIVLKAFVSYLWVRIVVVLGAAGFCLGFLVYIFRYWVMGAK